MDRLKSLFLAQSYEDAFKEYSSSIIKTNYVTWDYVILTASNEKQAEGFRLQLKERQKFLPKKTEFVVIPDLNGERIGSGGATLSAIKYVKERSGSEDFSSLKTLVIHSGGDSKRIPQYSALGKIFSPVPRKLPDGRNSTLFDEIIIATTQIPSRIGEGMLLLSGDALLLFNPLQVNFSLKDAAVLSFKETKEVGKNHGVFLRGENGNVKKFLHKQSVERLEKCGAVNEKGLVDIDTGAVIFSAELQKSLYSLIDDEKKFNEMVNSRVRLSLYADFLYPLAEDSTMEEFYSEQPEGEFSDELKIAREKIFNAINKYKLKLLRLSPAKFLHFGTTKEVLRLCTEEIDDYEYLGWGSKINSSVPDGVSGYNGVVEHGVSVGKNVYVENSYVHSGVKVCDNVVLSDVEIREGEIPSGVVLDALKLKNGKFVVRGYGVNDNPKQPFLLGVKIRNCDSLWNAKLFNPCDTVDEAVCSTLKTIRSVLNGGSIELRDDGISLEESFNQADSVALAVWKSRMHDLVKMNELLQGIEKGESVRTVAEKTGIKVLSKIQKEWIKDAETKLSFGEMIRLYFYLGRIVSGKEGAKYYDKAFKSISSELIAAHRSDIKYNEECRISSDSVVVKLPLRVNFGGGWSDTPPYCNENGGRVLNASILIENERPVEVSIKKLREKKIVFDSRDMDVHGEFDDIKDITDVGNPFDPFVLQKTCLIACGVIPASGGDLSEVLERLGGGFLMQTEVNNVPKGSGLGTSSILAAACAKAVMDFTGIKYTEERLYSVVFCMEQIMSTGGGWQDQVGGLTDGFKFITSEKGLKQKLSVEHLSLSERIKEEFNERFIVIYTGQRRLARNLLRDVVGRYLTADADACFALNEIKSVAEQMKNALLGDDFDEFARLLNYHWELSKKIDGECTNSLIEQIFLSIDEFLEARFICGAGGGGFLQAILKKGCTKNMVHDRLKEVFGDCDIDVYDTSLSF